MGDTLIVLLSKLLAAGFVRYQAVIKRGLSMR